MHMQKWRCAACGGREIRASMPDSDGVLVVGQLRAGGAVGMMPHPSAGRRAIIRV